MPINNDFIIEQKFNQGDTIYIIDWSVAKFYIFDEYFFDDKKNNGEFLHFALEQENLNHYQFIDVMLYL
jgi:hypothetical protein